MSTGLPPHSAIGPWRVVDFVGAGGMGTVYRVTHRSTGRVAAAKVMGGGAVSPRALDRFRNEARILQALSHPAIAQMYEFLDVQGAPCLVMEYVDGETLEHLLRTRGAFPLSDALRIFGALVDAVGYIHQRGIIHRDLKANNVKVDALGHVKLLDFGIAMAEGAPRLTSTGNVVGTLMALAPEQLRTGRADSRSDIWSLGILFYELLTARPPFEGQAPGVLGERILRGSYVPPSEVRPGLPREVDRIVGRCLKVRPEDRYASAEALLTDLRALQSGDHVARAPSAAARAGALGADLLRSSGEVATTLRREWRVALSAAMALAAVAFFVMSLSSPAEHGDATVGPVRPPPRVPLRPDVPDVPAEAVGEGNRGPARRGVAPEVQVPPRAPSTPPTTAGTGAADASVSHRPLIIRVLGGSADVFINAVHVGTTPYTWRAPLGTEVELVLRRAGCDDLRKPLKLEEGMAETFESLPRCRTP
jgi:eukaryotic-like serine/threonine-protein kinase